MPLILNIETSTEICSVGLALDGNILSHQSSASQNHASDVHTFIQHVISESGFTLKKLSAVAVSSGPGSYTGLRIGWATAKGLCYALNIPLITVSTLEAMAYKIISIKNGYQFYMPMIDARRMEVYTALYDNDLKNVLPVNPLILSSDMGLIYDSPIVYGGNGAMKAQSFMPPNSIFIPGIDALASSMAVISEQLYSSHQFTDIAYSEPFYLKDARITESKSK